MSDNKEDHQAPVTNEAETEQPPAASMEEEKKPEGDDSAIPPVVVENKKKPRSPKTASHPPYFQMIKEALMGLDEKSGSSPYAIAKYMEEKHKAVLPANFRKILAVQLKNSAAKGKLIKIRASYKLTESVKKEKSHPRTTTSLKASAKSNPTTKKKRKTKSVNNPETGKRGPKKSAAAAVKVKQPRSIRSPGARAKRANAAGG
ncbi:Histone H1 [Linum perenne]